MPNKLKDITGMIFSRWIVIERGSKFNYWKCSCVCGTVREVRGTPLRQGLSHSCGCLCAELSSVRGKARNRGNPARKRGTLEYFKCNTWNNMKKRTVNMKPDPKRNIAYIRKGIELRMTKDEFYEWCDGWSDEITGLIKPSIDRIDSMGHYEKGNIQIIEHSENTARRFK